MPSPTAQEIADLKRLTSGIIRSQGNRFIKELLRDKDIRIGVNKQEFEQNLNEAIEEGRLKLEDVSAWLRTVEGWGDQHVYLYKLSNSLCDDLSESEIEQKVSRARLGGVWDAETALAFPNAPHLTSISYRNPVLSLVWQEASPGWTPVPGKDYTKVEGLDTFEYRAYRMMEQRAITRFEAHLDKRLAAIFIPKPVQLAEHAGAIEEVRRVISLLMDISKLDRGRIKVSDVSRNIDQKSIPTNTNTDPIFKAQKSRLGSGGAYVEFGANSMEHPYWDEPAIKAVRNSIRAQQLRDFHGSDGIFTIQGPDTSHREGRRLRILLYGDENRIRLWAQMSSVEVWFILTKLSQYQ